MIIEMVTTKPPWNASNVSNHLKLIFMVSFTLLYTAHTVTFIYRWRAPELKKRTVKNTRKNIGIKIDGGSVALSRVISYSTTRTLCPSSSTSGYKPAQLSIK